MRTCSRCKQEKPDEQFAERAGRPGRRQSACIDCMRAYRREHYRSNPEPYKARAKARVKKDRFKIRVRVKRIMVEMGCADCPERDPLVLDFDHVRDQKRMDVSRMVTLEMSWESIEEEIKKCEVVCANCHRRRTATRAGWGEKLRNALKVTG